jgi:membrane protein
MASASRARARSAARRKKRPLRELVRIWVDLFDKHELLTYASAIALQALVAAVALLLLTLGVLGETGRQDVWRRHVGPAVQGKVLPFVYSGIDQVVEQIFSTDSTGLIAFASLLAIWEVSGVVRACMGALDRVYETDDDRPWWIRFPISIGLALTTIAGLGGALLLGALVGNGGGAWAVPALVGRWLGAIVLIGLAFGLIVRFAPAERRSKRWASAGAALVTVAWIVQSLIFRVYVGSVANFRTAAGSLTVLLVVTAYLYVGAIILLVGIELDELLRKDVQGEERGILELVRELL